uniref:NADH dehydrogenase subunit 6 n=1 Tax=Pseudosuccinea columella TaxID=31228 RepID=A0A4V1G5W0_PSECM|nr:NADH dehydrogenase subunit 6 [Pseudosuccinea columella]QCT09593.1 NADH dehydrogenase subunit 6 [Pseudosuccinea columella]
MIFITMILISCIFMSMFPVLVSPISLGGLLIFISVCFVILISLISSAWYGYLLFLVYIGGLLVLFIYMCMISSNTMFKIEIPQVILMFLLLNFYFSMNFSETSMYFLGNSTFDSGTQMNMSVFLSLVIILLVVFLAVVQIVKLKSSIQIESK